VVCKGSDGSIAVAETECTAVKPAVPTTECAATAACKVVDGETDCNLRSGCQPVSLEGGARKVGLSDGAVIALALGAAAVAAIVGIAVARRRGYLHSPAGIHASDTLLKQSERYLPPPQQAGERGIVAPAGHAAKTR